MFLFQGARYSFAVKMATSEEKARRKANEMEAQVLREALLTASPPEAQEIQHILQKLEKNELSNVELEQALRKYEKEPPQ